MLRNGIVSSGRVKLRRTALQTRFGASIGPTKRTSLKNTPSFTHQKKHPMKKYRMLTSALAILIGSSAFADDHTDEIRFHV